MQNTGRLKLPLFRISLPNGNSLPYFIRHPGPIKLRLRKSRKSVYSTRPRNWPKRIKKGTNGNSGSVPNDWVHGNQRIAQALGDVPEKSWPRSSNYLNLLNIARRSSVVEHRTFPSTPLIQTFGLIQYSLNSTLGRFRYAKRSPSISLQLQRGDCVQRVQCSRCRCCVG